VSTAPSAIFDADTLARLSSCVLYCMYCTVALQWDSKSASHWNTLWFCIFGYTCPIPTSCIHAPVVAYFPSSEPHEVVICEKWGSCRYRPTSVLGIDFVSISSTHLAWPRADSGSLIVLSTFCFSQIQPWHPSTQLTQSTFQLFHQCHPLLAFHQMLRIKLASYSGSLNCIILFMLLSIYPCAVQRYYTLYCNINSCVL
jgi:hypothetical protein